MKTGHTGPRVEPRRGPQAGKSGDPRSQNVDRYLSPLDRRGFDDEIDDTDEELYYLQKCQASKTPLFIPIQSHSLAPALFYCIRTTSIHLLLAAVAEPLYPLHDLSLPQ